MLGNYFKNLEGINSKSNIYQREQVRDKAFKKKVVDVKQFKKQVVLVNFKY